MRIGAENGHRRVTRPRLRIIEAETQGYPTGYLRAPPGTVKYDPEHRELKEGREKDEALLHSRSCLLLGCCVRVESS